MSFTARLNKIKTKIRSKINLIKRIKSFKWNTSIKTSIKLYKSYIRSIFDYCLTIVQTSTEKIKNEIQKIQNSILKTIKYFPTICSTNYIHQELKIEKFADRTNKQTFLQIHVEKMLNSIIINNVKEYLQKNTPNSRIKNKFTTPFEVWSNIHNLEN